MLHVDYPQCLGISRCYVQWPMHFCKALSWKSLWIKASAKWINVGPRGWCETSDLWQTAGPGSQHSALHMPSDCISINHKHTATEPHSLAHCLYACIEPFGSALLRYFVIMWLWHRSSQKPSPSLPNRFTQQVTPSQGYTPCVLWTCHKRPILLLCVSDTWNYNSYSIPILTGKSVRPPSVPLHLSCSYGYGTPVTNMSDIFIKVQWSGRPDMSLSRL